MRSSKHRGHDPAALADLLLCVLPGYLMQLALGGPTAVQHIPRIVQNGLADVSTADRSPA